MHEPTNSARIDAALMARDETSSATMREPKQDHETVVIPSPSDVDAWNSFLHELLVTGTQRLHAEVRRLEAAGIIDEHGNPLNDTLPPDMAEGSETTLGDW